MSLAQSFKAGYSRAPPPPRPKNVLKENFLAILASWCETSTDAKSCFLDPWNYDHIIIASTKNSLTSFAE